MRTILSDIVSNKKEEIAIRKKRSTADAFLNAVQKPAHAPALIAEIKLKSPSGGVLKKSAEIKALAHAYERGGASAISVVTDKRYFGGSPALVKKIKKHTKLPVLQKDFIVDSIQIRDAAQLGVDSLLLIARILPENTLQLFVSICLALSIEPLVEVYNEQDLAKALKTEARIIGVNARDLDTLQVDINRACRLIAKIPPAITKVGLSGVKSKEDVIAYKNAGAAAVLIGTMLMKSRDASRDIKKLLY